MLCCGLPKPIQLALGLLRVGQSRGPRPASSAHKKAQSILDSLPGNSLISKTAILSSTAGVAIYALSNEYNVVNEETIVALCLLSIWTAVFKYGGPLYTEWADGQVNKIKGILNAARADHTEAVKTRIESVQQLGSAVDITKTLFEVSKIRQQKELAESIIAKIQKELENPKVLQQILQQSVADVEKIVQSKAQ
ncbi:putative ATP synthase subunit 4, mitochondrial [Hyaloscypha sp. PMI_1271]|nr:putative ATP synthase subunit 4, mitochondrial [Hyaloscypha sp. PMI_1271]